MDTIYYNKYLKYKKKYLDLKEIEKTINQSGSWDATNPENFAGLRKYADISNNPISLKENDISNNFKSVSGYKHIDTGRYKYVYNESATGKKYPINMYVLDYFMIMNDMSSTNIKNDFGNGFASAGRQVRKILSDDKSAYLQKNASINTLNALLQVYMLTNFRDVSGIVAKYLDDPSNNYTDLSNAYHDLSHDVNVGGGFYFTIKDTVRSFSGIPSDASNMMRYYKDDGYGFDLSNTVILGPPSDPKNGLLIHPLHSNLSSPLITSGRIEYVAMWHHKESNVLENDKQALAVLGVLMKYHKYMKDNILDQAEKARLNVLITAIRSSLASVTNELIAKEKLLSEKTNDYSKEKFAKERLASKRDKTNQAISDLGKMLLELNGQKKKSNTITLSSFFGL
jgi:hypothetical protein